MSGRMHYPADDILSDHVIVVVGGHAALAISAPGGNSLDAARGSPCRTGHKQFCLVLRYHSEALVKQEGKAVVTV